MQSISEGQKLQQSELSITQDDNRYKVFKQRIRQG